MRQRWHTLLSLSSALVLLAGCGGTVGPADAGAVEADAASEVADTTDTRADLGVGCPAKAPRVPFEGTTTGDPCGTPGLECKYEGWWCPPRCGKPPYQTAYTVVCEGGEWHLGKTSCAGGGPWDCPDAALD